MSPAPAVPPGHSVPLAVLNQTVCSVAYATIVAVQVRPVDRYAGCGQGLQGARCRVATAVIRAYG